MSRDYDDVNGEYSTAVAAATFAIKNLEESRLRAWRETSEIQDSNLSNIKSTLSETRSDNRPEAVVGPAPYITRNSTSWDESANTTGSAPSIEITPTFADTNLNSPASTKPDIKRQPSLKSGNGNTKSDVVGPTTSNRKRTKSWDKSSNSTGSARYTEKTPIVDTNLSSPASTKRENLIPARNVPMTNTPTEIKKQPSLKQKIENIEADAWEKKELMKIQKRYEKVCARILNWETKKKEKAKRRLEKEEAGSDTKKANASQHYLCTIINIEHVAEAARAQAEGNRRMEELKVKTKANKMRVTGEDPVTCFCC